MNMLGLACILKAMFSFSGVLFRFERPSQETTGLPGRFSFSGPGAGPMEP